LQNQTYKNLTLEHLQLSCQRVKQTHDLLQQLQDRVLLSSLEASGAKASLPNSLRIIIADNKNVLNKIETKSSSI